jgi:hypothetical protein
VEHAPTAHATPAGRRTLRALPLPNGYRTTAGPGPKQAYRSAETVEADQENLSSTELLFDPVPGQANPGSYTSAFDIAYQIPESEAEAGGLAWRWPASRRPPGRRR